MKIKLNELKKLVRRVIKEEVERDPKEEMRNEFKVLIGNYNNAIEIQTEFKRFLNNTDTSKVSNLVENYFEKYSTLSSAVYNMFKVELPNSASPLDTLSILKIRLPKILEATLEVFSVLKKIYEISDNDELDNFIRKFQYGLLPFKMSIDRMLDLIPIVEPLYPQQQNNTPQQQNNVPQQQNTPKSQNNELGAKLQQMKDNVRQFNRSFETLKYKYIDDNITEKMFSNSVDQILAPIEDSIASILNLPLSESYLSRNKKSKRNIFENSFKITAVDNYFDRLIMDLNRYVNKLDESMGIEQVKGQLSTIRNIILSIKDNLQRLVRNPL